VEEYEGCLSGEEDNNGMILTMERKMKMKDGRSRSKETLLKRMGSKENADDGWVVKKVRLKVE
jgi:hypothetical protein